MNYKLSTPNFPVFPDIGGVSIKDVMNKAERGSNLAQYSRLMLSDVGSMSNIIYK
jgi:hypothetical protein